MSCSCGCGGKKPNTIVSVNVRVGKTTVSVQTSGEACCSRSHLRGEGIKKTSTRGLYFADANLICVSPCFGFDDKTVYEWTLTPTDKANPGNLRIVGSSRKVGDDRVEVAGTGTFDLSVKVTFECRKIVKKVTELVTCVRAASVRFTQ